MSDLEKIISNLSNYFNNEGHIKATFEQTKKDLAHLYEDREGQPLKFDMDHLQSYFNPIFEHLLNNRKQDLVQFLYRVDLSENSIGRALDTDDLKQGVINLTRSILERELKKVIIRKHYSSES
jgi:hypothetical protein